MTSVVQWQCSGSSCGGMLVMSTDDGMLWKLDTDCIDDNDNDADGIDGDCVGDGNVIVIVLMVMANGLNPPVCGLLLPALVC